MMTCPAELPPGGDGEQDEYKFLDLCHSRENSDWSQHQQLDKIRPVLLGLSERKHREPMASMTVLWQTPPSQRTLLRNRSSSGQTARCALEPSEHYVRMQPAPFVDLRAEKTSCNAVKCIDLWCLRRAQLLMNIA